MLAPILKYTLFKFLTFDKIVDMYIKNQQRYNHFTDRVGIIDGPLYGVRKNWCMKEDLEKRVREITDGYGTTVTIDAACVKDSLLNALKVTGNAGRVITMGFSVADTIVNQFLITSKELDVRGSRLQNRKFGEAIDLIKAGKLDLNGTVSHTFKLTDAQKAFDFVDSRDPSIRKIALTFEDLD